MCVWQAVEMLLKQRCDLTIQDSNGRTALLWTAYYGHPEVEDSSLQGYWSKTLLSWIEDVYVMVEDVSIVGRCLSIRDGILFQ